MTGKQPWSNMGRRDDLRGDIWDPSCLRLVDRKTLQSSEMEGSETWEEFLTIRIVRNDHKSHALR